MNVNLNTQILQHVLEVSRCGSISRAAQNLFVSQPNLSTSIKALEESLGFPIFIRSPKGITATQEGTLFLKSAEIIVAEMENIGKIPALCAQTREEGLSVVCVSSPDVLELLMRFIQGSSVKYRKNTFKETGLNRTLEDIIAKTYRLGFFYDFECNHHKRKMLAEKYFLDIHLLRRGVPIVALVRRDHELAGCESVSVEQIARCPLITYEDFDHEDWLGAIGIDRCASMLYIFDRGGMAEGVRGGAVGISVGSVLPGTEDGGIREIPISGIASRLDQYWIKSATCRLHRFESDFIRFVRTALTSRAER